VGVNNFSDAPQDDFTFFRCGCFFTWFSQYKTPKIFGKNMQNTCYIFGYQINNMYICINEKATGSSLTPRGKKKNEMREHLLIIRQLGFAPLSPTLQN
jgi:hypothetical protein